MSEPFIGEIRATSFNFPPKGWVFCNGQLLPINQNQALFSILGTTYGGDGRTTFGLPDLRSRVPMHVGSGHVLGEKGGQEAHTLVAGEIGSHSHAVTQKANPGAATVATPAGNVWAAPAAANIYGASQDHPMSATAVTVDASTGGGQPHANVQPYLTISFIIALQGIFPSRN